MNILKLLAFMESRKVGIALWIFIVANVYLVKKLITSDEWFTCVGLVTALVGGGTLGDKFLAARKQEPPKQ